MSRGWVEQDIIPMTLHRLTWPDTASQPEPQGGISIAAGMSGYADLFLVQEDRFHILAQDRRPQAFDRVLSPGRGIHRVQLIIGSDNAQLTTSVVECVTTDPPFFAQMTQPAEIPGDFKRAGRLYNMQRPEELNRKMT